MNRQIILICFFLFTSYRLTKAEDELKIEVIEKPSADKCQRTTKDGDTLSIHYTGRLAKSGKVFDSSRDRKEPFEFTLGKGMVIQGYEQGLKDMCVGEHRKLTIPSHLGYGKAGMGTAIPADATLEFEVQLLTLKTGKLEEEEDEQQESDEEVFQQIDTDRNGELSKEEIRQHIKRHSGRLTPKDEEDSIVADIFQDDDKDKDGIISYKEFMNPTKKDEL